MLGPNAALTPKSSHSPPIEIGFTIFCYIVCTETTLAFSLKSLSVLFLNWTLFLESCNWPPIGSVTLTIVSIVLSLIPIAGRSGILPIVGLVERSPLRPLWHGSLRSSITRLTSSILKIRPVMMSFETSTDQPGY